MGNICCCKNQNSVIIDNNCRIIQSRKLNSPATTNNDDDPVFFVVVICNGNYKPNLFNLDIITFAKLLGYKVDLTKVLNFLRQTIYNPDKYPENLFIMVDTTKEEFEDKWKELDEKIAKLSRENRRKIYPFIFYSGHGVASQPDG